MKRYSRLLFALVFLSVLPLGAQSVSSVARRDFYVESEPGIRIYLREIRSDSAGGVNGPILLVHGARVPGIASFDLPVPGGSLAEDLADSGYIVYVIDIRGYGRSTRPKEMSEPAGNNTPLVRSIEAVRDIDGAGSDAGDCLEAGHLVPPRGSRTGLYLLLSAGLSRFTLL